MELVERILANHRRTKHSQDELARATSELDWGTQPEPFRSFARAAKLTLPLGADALDATFDDLGRLAASPQPLSLGSLGTFLELSLGLSAWKEFGGSRWALRVNPSSGNLHPVEGWVVAPPLPGVEPGVYHYHCREHALERRSAVEPGRLPACLGPGAFLVALSSIHWRVAWKYGDRAFRLSQLDAGHVLACLRYAAQALGWSARLVDGPPDAALAGLLGLDRQDDYRGLSPEEAERPEAALLVRTGTFAAAHALEACSAFDEIVAAARAGAWEGAPSPVSTGHVRWDLVHDAAEASLKPATAPAGDGPGDQRLPAPRTLALSRRAAEVIRSRRSAIGYDPAVALGLDAFLSILDHLLPRPGLPPWDALTWEPQVHPVFFVHRVEGLTPGLYLLERSAAAHEPLKDALRASFAFSPVAGVPAHLRLFLLQEGDFREEAVELCCNQDVGGDGAFAVAMLGELDDSLRVRGAWWYRRLNWEAGMLGQALYLAAEAVGHRGVGLGSFLDDPTHELLGLADERFQSLYHFSVGAPVDDRGVVTRPPYKHLSRR